MTPRSYPNCPICALLSGPQERSIDAFEAICRQWAAQRCRCPGLRHRVLAEHPHAVEGCLGFGVIVVDEETRHG